jgi:hypothetical protein
LRISSQSAIVAGEGFFVFQKEGNMKSKKFKVSAIIFYSVIIALALGLPNMAFAGTIQLPKTGQTICYDTDGNVIGCAGTGQDGNIQAGVAWPNPRFTDHGDGTVTDKLTGLMWTKDANPAGYLTWQQALDYVQTLNTGGHTDWRLPNINELQGLIDYSVHPPLPLGHPFTNMQSVLYYWSSTTIAFMPSFAWVVEMISGSAAPNEKSLSITHAWPVRAGQCGSLGNSVICLSKTGQTKCYDTLGTEISCAGTGQDGDIQAGVAWPNPRFTDHGNGTVNDNLTGLMWTKDAKPAGNTMTWQQALDYMQTLNTGGHTDWRLPNVNELKSLVDYSPSIPDLSLGHPFTNVQFGSSWSSTSHAFSPDGAWIVHVSGGIGSNDDKSNGSYYAWPVRAGQVGPVTTTTTMSLTTTTTISNNTTTSTFPNSTTTTTTTSGPCAAETIYGENSEQTELLREYRDKVLSKTPEGQEIIKTYYKFSPTVTKLLKQRPMLKNRAKTFIDNMLPGIRRKVADSMLR